jgi:glycosyltransferase involved in cell wall biosynthesis
MRILLVSLYFHPATAYGGPVASTWSLAKALAGHGARLRVLTTDADGDRRLGPAPDWAEAAPGVEVLHCRRLGAGLLAPAMAWHAIREVRRADWVYVSGLFVWLLPWLSLLTALFGKPLVVAPRGRALPEALAGKSAKKRLFLAVARIAGLGRARFQATSETESDHLRSLFPESRVAVIPNGVEMPRDKELVQLAPRSPAEPPYLLYLGRIHPHKQLERLVEAFRLWAASSTTPGHSKPLVLRLVGPGDPELRERLRSQAHAAGIQGRVQIEPSVSGQEKSRLLANAEGLLLASKSENFGMAIAEGLAHATPALVTRTAPWSGLEEMRCGFWVDDDPAALAAALERFLGLSTDARLEMGQRGRAWMGEEFAWPSLAQRILELATERP